MVKLMTEVAKTLHLKQHILIDELKQKHDMWMAVDVEGHRAKGGRFYECDLARLLPPTRTLT